MGIGKRIKEAREALGLTQTELAELIGVTGSAITNYEKETSHPKEPIMYKLFDALKVDANYLFQDVVNIPAKKNDVTLAEYDMVKRYRFLDDTGRDHMNTILLWETDRITKNIPAATEVLISSPRIISYYQRLASAGNGQVIYDDIPAERITIPDIPEYARVAYAIGVNGHSMEPLYYDGDVLLIEPTCEISTGEIGIFIVGNESFVKKLGHNELISLNHDYRNIPLTDDSKCMGRVVDSLRNN